MDRIIDLRSDTITVPDAEMREAMKNALVGDDILGEDITVKELEEIAAKMLGMEAALLVISGTMANQLAVMTFTERGQEIIVGKESHIYNLEVAGLSTLSQVQARPVDVIRGFYDPEVVEEAVQPIGIQRATTGLICLENTYNLNEGWVVRKKNMAEIRNIAAKYNVPVYLDGARLLNAATFLKIEPREICKHVDAVQVCLTKGLGGPLGSILAGSKEFIEKARRFRQRIGGGMRQAGIIAAPGIIALSKRSGRLGDDHVRAFKLAEELSRIDGLHINPSDVETNILSPNITKEGFNTSDLVKKLEAYKIKVKPIDSKKFRMITHLQFNDNQLDYVIQTFKEILG